MKNTFYNLSEQKQKNILSASIMEFSKYTYDGASLNRIISEAKISKGGLFKYIENKHDLYIYTVGEVLEEVIEFQLQKTDYSSNCFFHRLKELTIAGFQFYKSNQDKYRMELNVLIDFSSPFYREIQELRNNLIQKHQNEFLKNIYWDNYILTKDEILRVSGYLIAGFNIRLISYMKEIDDIETLEKQAMNELDLIFKVIRTGTIKGDKND